MDGLSETGKRMVAMGRLGQSCRELRDVLDNKQLTAAFIIAMQGEFFRREAGLPSAADLDAVAEEQRIKEATSPVQVIRTPFMTIVTNAKRGEGWDA